MDMKPISLTEFYDRLMAFDFAYEYSDDHSVFMAGANELGRLAAIAETSAAHRQLFDAFSAHHQARNRLLAAPPLPQRPKEAA